MHAPAGVNTMDAHLWPVDNTWNLYPDEQLGPPAMRLWNRSAVWSESLAMYRWDRALQFFYLKDHTPKPQHNHTLAQLVV